MIAMSNSEIKEALNIFLPIALVIIIMIPIAILITRSLMKHSGSMKPLVTKRVKILERRMPQNSINLFCTYCVETDTGERLILKNFDEKKLIIKEGDQGMMSYRGKTIISFERI